VSDLLVADDLSALAWVQGELRRTLEAAHKSLRRYLKDAENVAGGDLDAVDPSVLRSCTRVSVRLSSWACRRRPTYCVRPSRPCSA
jgi:predicted phage gp36 major capsid-like protein